MKENIAGDRGVGFPLMVNEKRKTLSDYSVMIILQSVCISV